MKIGDMVKIKKCKSLPELVGENAEIVDMRFLYPLWVKMTSGERKGKIYGVGYGEVEILPKAYEAQGTSKRGGVETVKKKVAEQVEEQVLVGPALGFWEGKTPCWEMVRCPEAIKIDCPAFKYRSLPCWEIQGTYSKLNASGSIGLDTSICKICLVYKRYGHGEPINLKLFGKGIDTSLKPIEKSAKREADRVKQ